MQLKHNWANEPYHTYSVSICHFLQDFSFSLFFESPQCSPDANNRLVHQLYPPLELIGSMQRKPLCSKSLRSWAFIRSLDTDHPHTPLIYTHNCPMQTLCTRTRTHTHTHTPPALKTHPCGVEPPLAPVVSSQMSWEAWPDSFHTQASSVVRSGSRGQTASMPFAWSWYQHVIFQSYLWLSRKEEYRTDRNSGATPSHH